MDPFPPRRAREDIYAPGREVDVVPFRCIRSDTVPRRVYCRPLKGHDTAACQGHADYAICVPVWKVDMASQALAGAVEVQDALACQGLMECEVQDWQRQLGGEESFQIIVQFLQMGRKAGSVTEQHGLVS